MPFPTKDYPSTAEIARWKAEDEFFQLYNANPENKDSTNPRWLWKLKEFFENDETKAKILDVALHLSGVIVDSGTDFLFGKAVEIAVDGQGGEATDKIIADAVKRTNLQQKLKESGALFQSVGHTHFKLYGESKDGKIVACFEEVPYKYWSPNWAGVPLGAEPTDVRIPAYITTVDATGVETKYIYIENYYFQETKDAAGTVIDRKVVCAKSAWKDKNGQIAEQVALDAVSVKSKGTLDGLTAIEQTNLTELPIVSVHVRKTALDRYGQSALKRVRPLLIEINDRLTQLSLQFLKHLNAKLQIPEGSAERNLDGTLKRVNMEVLLARAGDPDAKYITNDNPLIEQAFKHLDSLIRKVAKLSQTPDSFLLEDDKGGVESAESLRTRLMLFLKRISNYESTYAPAVEKIIRLMLMIEGVKDAETIQLKIDFDPGLPKDWKNDVDVWGNALAQGIASTETAVRMFQGLDETALQEELTRIEDEKTAMMQSQLDLMTAKTNADPNAPPPNAPKKDNPPPKA